MKESSELTYAIILPKNLYIKKLWNVGYFTTNDAAKAKLFTLQSAINIQTRLSEFGIKALFFDYSKFVLNQTVCQK